MMSINLKRRLLTSLFLLLLVFLFLNSDFILVYSLIILSVVEPIEPVEPSIMIFFFII